MNISEVKKAILRPKSIEFTRLLLLAMIEDAEDTFWAVASVLRSELLSFNLTSDEYLQELCSMIERLRDKLESKHSVNLTTSSSSKVNDIAEHGQKDDPVARSRHGFTIKETGQSQPLVFNSDGILINLANEVKNGDSRCKQCNVISEDLKFHNDDKMCSSCHLKKPKDSHTLLQLLGLKNILSSNSRRGQQSNSTVEETRECFKCKKKVPFTARKAYFKGMCSSCYYKVRRLTRLGLIDDTRLPETSPTPDPQTSEFRECCECQKQVPKGTIFYRSSQLCKNCYERRRVLIRKQTGAQQSCIRCNRRTERELLQGKCITCYYKEMRKEGLNDFELPPSNDDESSSDTNERLAQVIEPRTKNEDEHVDQSEQQTDEQNRRQCRKRS
ncbi:hypothetical protein M3Y96_00628400 [Aphelenchoides besseyi]|nr:hypothetical protein M3Y96_00628400 [Aphelenchoides besseyi]